MQTSMTAAQQVPEAAVSTAFRALVALACRLGVDVTVEQLHRRFALPPGEPETGALIAMARELGLEAQALRMSFRDLPRVSRALPAILRAKGGGALILEEARTDPAKGTVAVIRDPSATGDVVLAVDELHLAEIWEGEVILVKRRYSATVDDSPFNLAWLFGQLMRERKLFKGVVLAGFVATVFAIAPAFIMRLVIDRVLVEESLSTLNVVALAVLLLIGFEATLGFARRVLTQVIVTRMDGRINLYIMEKILKLPMEFFERTPIGRTVTNLQMINLIRGFLTTRFFTVMVDIIPLVGLVPVMVLVEWHMALMAFAMGAMVFLILFAYMKPIHRKFRKVVLAEQAKGAYLNETLYGMRTVKSLSLEGRRRREWDGLVATAVDARHALGLLANYPETFALPFTRLIITGSMIFGAYLYLYYLGLPNPVTLLSVAATSPGTVQSPTETITPGALIAFYILSSRLAQPLVSIAELQRDQAEVEGAIAQVGQVVNVVPEETRLNGLRMPIRGEVTFSGVRFRYSPEAPYALDGVSFAVPAGTNLGIMGRSGSGKTTVTRLLQCLNTSYEGMIKIDGMDLREINLMHLRTHIGVVPQENFLFSGTIRENIAMAKPDATFADVVRAAQLGGAEEFIERLPRGYDTPIQEGGSNLSGGQRQRLALARALLIDPPVLILDEATSALDAESEAIVNANLTRMAKGRTVLSISHRLSMLVECDAILVLEQGKLYDMGTHEELLHRCDIYKHMWYQQNRHLKPSEQDMRLVVRGATV
jgi:ATP-binding cassette subfamily B protein